jgi:hypothetical protein
MRIRVGIEEGLVIRDLEMVLGEVRHMEVVLAMGGDMVTTEVGLMAGIPMDPMFNLSIWEAGVEEVTTPQLVGRVEVLFISMLNRW